MWGMFYHRLNPKATADAQCPLIVDRRMTIALSETLRTRTVMLAKELHLLRDTLSVPSAKYSAKCCRCSLQELCMPKIKMSAESYLLRLRQEAAGIIEEASE